MADTRRTEVVITCNSQQPRAAVKAMKTELDKLTKTYNQLVAAGKAGSDKAKQMKQDIKDLSASVKEGEANMNRVNKVVKNLGEASLRQLRQALKQVKKEIDRTAGNSPKLATLKDQYKAIDQQIRTLSADIGMTNSAINKQSSAWKTAFRNISMYFGVFQMFSIAQQKFQQFFRGNLDYSDQLADIRKVTGFASRETAELSNRIAKIDTRSSVQELADLAYQGGKMGYGKYGVEGMLEFVRAADQVKVALSDDLGDDSLLQLSKLIDTMGLVSKMGVEQSMLSVGSAINQLSATSTASGEHIVDFAKRLTGLARITGITTPELLALGSAADALGQAPEVAATALGKLFTSLQTNHNLIEKELGMEKGVISNLFQQGKAMEAILQIMDKMREKGNMNALGNVWKDLGSEGQRLIGVMATMSKNVDTVRAHVFEANEAFEEATSLTNEYSLKQETANAILLRANNLWEKAFINPKGVDTVKGLAEAWYDLSKSMTGNAVTMFTIKGLIALIVAEFRVLLQLLPAILLGLMFKGTVSAVTAVASSVGLMGKNAVLATLQTNGLTAAWRALNVAQKANVIGLCITLLASLAIGIAGMIEKGQQATRWMEGFNGTMSDFNRDFAIGVDKLDRFKKAIDEAAVGTKQRQAAIRNFNKEFGQYLSKMLTEKSTAADLAEAYKEVVKQLRAKIALQLKEKDIEQQVTPRVGWSADRLTEYDQIAGGSAYNGTWLKAYVDDMRAKGKSVEQLNADLAKKLGVNESVAADAYKHRSDATLRTHYFDKGNYKSQAQYDMDGGWTASENASRDLKQNEQMLYAAVRYASQSFSASKAMERVNKKWQPFEADFAATVEEDSLGTLDQDAPDKEELKRRKREEAERRKALRAEMNEEKAKAQAIIDNVRNYYERQISAITEMATNTGMSEEWQRNMTDGMTSRMNTALANVRQAIAGTENEWGQFRQSMVDDLYEPLGVDGTNQSTQLLDNIIHNDIEGLKQMISSLSKELGQNNSVLLDQIWRKATENQLANTKQENSAYQRRQQTLLNKNYTGQVNRDYEGQMEQLGVAELAPGQSHLVKQWSQEGNKDALRTYVEERSRLWQEAFLKARENMVQVFSLDVSTEDGQKAMLTLLFGKDYEQVLRGSALQTMLNMDAQMWQVFYDKLIDYSDAYSDAQKKAYEEGKRRADFMFNNRKDVRQIDGSTSQLDAANRDQQRFGSDKNVTQQLGLSWDMSSDPEILRYRLLELRAREYYAEMERLRQQDKISEAQLTDAKKQMLTAQANTADAVAAKFNERVQLLQRFSQPMADFAESFGDYLASLSDDTEDSNAKLRDMAKTMLKAYAKMTLQLIAEDLTRRVTKKLYQAQEESDEMQHQGTLLAIQQTYQSAMLAAQTTSGTATLTQQSTQNAAELAEEANTTTGKVGLGIAGGAAKIIETLGFWGIPLIAVISSLLMGLLSWAIDLALGGSNSSSSDSGPNVKLASGMLTYDSGNVQAVAGGRTSSSAGTATVVGNDGHIYQAKQVDQLKTGIVDQPIATMVNGQPALVAERGPEMVIGRETTAAMMMARPDLLAAIVKFDRNHSGVGLPTYDRGNVADLAVLSDAPASGLTADDIASLRTSLDGFAAVLAVIQKNGLHVNKYGRGGVAQAAADGRNFMQRNSGDRLWNKG